MSNLFKLQNHRRVRGSPDFHSEGWAALGPEQVHRPEEPEARPLPEASSNFLPQCLSPPPGDKAQGSRPPDRRTQLGRGFILQLCSLYNFFHPILSSPRLLLSWFYFLSLCCWPRGKKKTLSDRDRPLLFLFVLKQFCQISARLYLGFCDFVVGTSCAHEVM